MKMIIPKTALCNNTTEWKKDGGTTKILLDLRELYFRVCTT